MEHPVIAAARDAGIVGQGGAGFPTHVKLAAAVDTVIANGCQCEPSPATDPDTMHRLSCAFLKIGPERCDDALAIDGLGEIVNVLMGYVVRNVLPDDVQYRAFPPDLATPAAQLAADRDRSLALLMNSRLGPFVLLVGD